MSTAIDLQKFCATNDPRPYLLAPWRCAEGVGATNGHILICVSDDGGQYADVKDNIAPVVSKFKAGLSDPARLWFDAASLVLPEPVKCRHCDGTGYTYEDDCDECDGEGEFMHGSHFYDCKECDGSGKIDGHGSGEKKSCWSCSGTGEGFAAVKVGQATLQRKYLSMLAHLPGCRIGTLGANDAAVFTFDGGFGAVMCCRGDE